MNKEVSGLMKQRRIAREKCKEKDKEIERLNNIINKTIVRIKEGIFSDEGVICTEDSQDLLDILEERKWQSRKQKQEG